MKDCRRVVFLDFGKKGVKSMGVIWIFNILFLVVCTFVGCLILHSS